MSSAAEILIKARNQASQALNAAGRDMQALADDTKDAAGAIDGASKVMAKAMRGDLVGAFKEVVKFWKSLGAAFAANPFGAAIAAVGLLAVGISKAIAKFREMKQAKEEAESAAADAAQKAAERAAQAEAAAAERARKRGERLVNVVMGSEEERRKNGIDEMVANKDREGLQRKLDESKRLYEEGQRQVNWAWNITLHPEKNTRGVNPEVLSEHGVARMERAKALVDEYQGALDKIEANEAAAREKAAKEEEAARAKRIAAAAKEAEAEAGRAAASVKAKKEELSLAEKRLDVAEKALAAEKATRAAASAKQDLANAQGLVASTGDWVKRAREEWSKRGIAGFQDRHEAQRQAAKEAADERQLQRQLGRYERGARDRGAVAAHNLQFAREAAEAAQSDAAAKAKALGDAEKQKEADKLAALSATAQEASAAVAELKALNAALVGG